MQQNVVKLKKQNNMNKTKVADELKAEKIKQC